MNDLIEDSDGLGSADSMKIFTEDRKTEVTNSTAKVLLHDSTVYATVAPDVWNMRDAFAETPARRWLLHGYGRQEPRI